MQEDHCPHGSTKEDKEDDDEAAQHTARLGGCPAPAQTGEQSQEAGDHEDDQDEHEVGCVGWVSLVQVRLNILA